MINYESTTADVITLIIMAVAFFLFWWFGRGVVAELGTPPEWRFQLGVDDILIKPVAWSLNTVTIRATTPCLYPFDVGHHLLVIDEGGHAMRFRIMGVARPPQRFDHPCYDLTCESVRSPA